ncbi:hypothetical protein F5Y04DRAFT_248171 [Hypomontagnella monticulosa]|nr:hypothetical protein F5Y04DRAFT_248171 [Hypomontagnella monticulosa]
MSTFAIYCDWTITVLKCLDGEPPRLAQFQLCEDPIEFQKAEIEPVRRVAKFYHELLVEVEGSRLKDRRKQLYRKFKANVLRAHAAFEEIRSSTGGVSRLRGSFAHIHEALEAITDLKEYDDSHPVHWSEVFPTQDVKSKLSPKELWYHFKLESIRVCLVFLVRLLELALPDFSDIWDECKESLTVDVWIRQFILDSPRAREVKYPDTSLQVHREEVASIYTPTTCVQLTPGNNNYF